jgi:hypothetical protein
MSYAVIGQAPSMISMPAVVTGPGFAEAIAPYEQPAPEESPPEESPAGDGQAQEKGGIGLPLLIAGAVALALVLRKR